MPGDPNLYDVLWTHQSASDEDLRRAYKRQRELYQPGSLPLTSLLKGDQLRAEASARGRSARHLARPAPPQGLRRLGLPCGASRAAQAQRRPGQRARKRSVRCCKKSSPARSTGRPSSPARCCAKCAKSQGIELSEIAKLTKISSTHLQAIEARTLRRVAALVYTRGFVQQLAKFLKLDPTQVSKTYLRRLREWRALSDGDQEP